MGPSGLSHEHQPGGRMYGGRMCMTALYAACNAAVEYERTWTRREQLMYHVLQMVLGPRNATLVLESLYGHEDRFRGGADDPSNMENKLTATRGDPLEGVTLECALAQPLTPGGCACIPALSRGDPCAPRCP